MIAIAIARLEHWLRRRRQRKCECGRVPGRPHQMILHPEKFARGWHTWFGEYYMSFTFKECECGEVVLIKSDDKWYWFF